MVGSNGLAGLHMDFNLRQSLAMDGSGNLIINNGTIAVTPALDVMAVSASSDLGQITEFTGNIVSVNTTANTFVMQGPFGFQETIDVNSSTLYNGSNTLSSLMANGIVSVEGTVPVSYTHLKYPAKFGESACQSCKSTVHCPSRAGTGRPSY